MPDTITPLFSATPATFTALFLAAFILTFGLRLWLALRQMRHVWLHRDTPPAAFAEVIGIDAHRRAADYTLAKTRLGLAGLAVEAMLLYAFTLGGGLQALAETVARQVESPLIAGALTLLALAFIHALAELPLAVWRQFRTEARFGFNRQTPAGFAVDLVRQAGLGLVLGGSLILLVLWLMAVMGELWWLWVWLAWMGFNLLVLAIWPIFIAPLFNTFTPLADAALNARIEALLARTGFSSNGIYVMDGSRRSSHGNAYFTGLGQSKRIVFYDTLLERLSPEQVEAVLAHELGHYRRRHIAKRIGLMFGLSLILLLALAALKGNPAFYAGLGVSHISDATALALFFMVLPLFTFPLTPLMSLYSRRHEFEADAFAAQHSQAAHLIGALVRLYRDNAATLTPDPIHSLFYDSHPKASERIARLDTQALHPVSV